MKVMKKALALGLALAMVVTAVPVTSAQAASTAKLSAKTVSVAAGTAKKQTKSVKVTTPSTWKSVKVKASSSDKKIATVKVSGKTVKVTAVKKGSAKVTVKVSAKKSGKTVKKTLTAKVKVINAGLRFVDPATEVVVGESVTLTAKKSPKAAVVTFKSSDDTIATVDADGKVTAVKAGKVTITATSDYGKVVTTEVTVKSVLLKEVKQTKLNTFEAVVAGKTADLKPASFTVTNKTTGQKILVDTVSVDKVDTTKVTLTTYVGLTNGNDIDVTLDGVTKSIKATDGKIASVTVDPVSVPYATETKIEAVVKDAAGVELNRFAYGATPSEYTFDITPAKASGYVVGEKLYLAEKGDTATAKVEYSTKTYDEAGKSIVISSGVVTITAVDPTTVTTNKIAMRIGDQNKNYNDLKDNTVIAKNDTKYAAVKIIDSKNNEISNYSDYTLESSNRNILLVADTALEGSNATIQLNAVAEGTTAILLKDKTGKTVETFPITVRAERKPATLTADHPTFTVTTDSAFTFNNKVVKFTLKDQYGEALPITTGAIGYQLSSKCELSPTADTATTKDNYFSAEASDASKFKFNGNSTVEPGTYRFKFKVSLGGQHNENINTTVTVYAKSTTPSGATTYKLAAIGDNNFETTTVNTTVTKANAKTLANNGLKCTLKVLKLVGGVPVDYVSYGSLSFTKPDGNKGTATSAGVAATIATNSALNVATFTAIQGGTTVVTKAAVGTYKVQVTSNGAFKTLETSVAVVDNQDKVTVTRVKETTDKRGSTVSDYTEEIKDAFDFKYDGAPVDDNIIVTASDVVENTNNIYVKTIKAKVQIDSINLVVDVPINQYIAIK